MMLWYPLYPFMAYRAHTSKILFSLLDEMPLYGFHSIMNTLYHNTYYEEYFNLYFILFFYILFYLFISFHLFYIFVCLALVSELLESRNSLTHHCISSTRIDMTHKKYLTHISIYKKAVTVMMEMTIWPVPMRC